MTGPARLEIDGIVAPGVPGPDGPVELHVELQRDAGLVVRLDAATYGARSRVALSLLDLPLRPDQLLELIPPELRKQREELGRAAGHGPARLIPTSGGLLVTGAEEARRIAAVNEIAAHPRGRP